ncbi:MAG: PAS domain S-box protein [Bacteroidota bacterium]
MNKSFHSNLKILRQKAEDYLKANPIEDSAGAILAEMLTLFNELESEQITREPQDQKEEKYRNVFENMLDVYYEASLDGIILEISPSIETISKGQFTREELIGKSFVALYANAEARDAFFVELSKQGKVIDYEVLMLNKDGSNVPCAISSALMYDKLGNPVKVAGILRDITQRKFAEQQIKDLNESLENKVKERTVTLIETNENLEKEIDNRIKTEAELLWNKSLLELMSNSSPLGFLVVDNRTDAILYFNHRFCEIWGIEHIEDQMQRGELSNNGIIPYCLPVLSDIPAFAESCKPLQDEENRVVLEDEIEFTKNRTVRRFTTQIRGENDEYFGRFYIFEDISARKHIEEALRESERQFSLFMDYLPAVVFLKDHEGRTLFVNNYMDIAFGAKAWMGKTMQEVFPNEIGERLTSDDHNSMLLGYQKLEESMVQLDGKLHHYETQKFFIDRPGQEPWLGGIAMDITERRIAEELLKSKMAILEAQKNASPDGILVIDITREEILVINKSYIEMFEVPTDIMEQGDARGLFRHILGLVKNPDKFIEITLSLYDHPNTNNADEIELKNGKILYRFSAPVLGLDGVNYGRIWTFHDITLQKQAEEDIIKSRDDAYKANLAKSEFLSRMSHELRTPMNSILGYTQLMNMGELNPKQKKSVDHILNSGKHLLNLIDEVLDISHIEAGRLSMVNEAVDLNSIVDETIDTIQPLAYTQQLKVIFEMSPTSKHIVVCDRKRIKQVLINLLNNAVKYNRPGGSIYVNVLSPFPNNAGISMIRISVRDTGMGISPEDISKLFMPFERIGAENTYTEGTGLGLAVIKKNIDAMGGSVGVESVVGEGSTFWVDLPMNHNAISTTPLINEKKRSGKNK